MTDTEMHDLRVLILTKFMVYHPSNVMPGGQLDPLTDHNAAMEALEAFIESKGGRGKACYSIGTPCTGPKFSVAVLSGIDRVLVGSMFGDAEPFEAQLESHGSASADTLPLAVCLALKAAVGGGE